jgi:hypothetical protein
MKNLTENKVPATADSAPPLPPVTAGVPACQRYLALTVFATVPSVHNLYFDVDEGFHLNSR